MASGLVFDTGVLILAERNPRAFRVLWDEVVTRGVVPVIPAPVIAQYWRGGRGAQVRGARVIKACDVRPMDLEVSKAAGDLLGRCGTADVVDAAVVVVAMQLDASIVTSDPGDIKNLLAAAGVTREVIVV